MSACIAAYGDAVLPQITEAIGRTMLRLVPAEFIARAALSHLRAQALEAAE